MELDSFLKDNDFVPLFDIHADKTAAQAVLKNQKKISEFFEGLGGSEHIILLYHDKYRCKQIQREFLTSGPRKSPRIYFSHKTVQIPNVINFIYDGFVGDSKTLNKLWNEHIESVRSQNKTAFPTRIADEECSWWLKDFLDETINYEKESGKELQHDTTALCSYDMNEISKYPHDKILDLITNHGYVIIEQSFQMYKNKKIITKN